MMSQEIALAGSAGTDHLPGFLSRFSLVGLTALLVGCGAGSNTVAPMDDAEQGEVSSAISPVAGVAIAGDSPPPTVAVAVSAAVSARAESHLVPMFPAASDPDGRQGFVRVINHSDQDGEVQVDATDDSGMAHGPVTLSIKGRQTLHFNSDDLEGVAESPKSYISGSTGAGDGDWWLELTSDLDIEVLSYIRTTDDGFLTAMHDLVPETREGYRVAIFNPGKNSEQESRLRLINPGDQEATVTIEGIDGNGDESDDVTAAVPAGAALTFTAKDLEDGGERLTGSMGTGAGKWQLVVTADQPILVMSLLSAPTGHLTNLSTKPPEDVQTHIVPLFPAASDDKERQGFVRVINHSDQDGEVQVDSTDDSGTAHAAVTLSIEGNQTLHFNSDDLEGVAESPKSFISGSTGAGDGDWWLELTSDLDIEVLSYIRTTGDGFLTAMHDVAPSAAKGHRVAIFNPGSNDQQKSRLRLINTGDEEASVAIKGTDGDGESPGGEVTTTISARGARSFTAADLESGAEGLGGRLGGGNGKWQLTVESAQPIIVMSLMELETGHLTNLSTAPERGARDLEQTAEEIFEASISASIVQGICIECHTEGGRSAHTRLVFVDDENEDHQAHNIGKFKNLLGEEDWKYILNKVSNVSGHGGGLRLAAGSQGYEDLKRFLERLQQELRESSDSGSQPVAMPVPEGVGYPTFASPHSNPIAVTGGYVYVANTPADTVDVIDADTRTIANRINVGVDPVGVVARPDGREVWVANHVSDTVSVIDTNPDNRTFGHVIATVQAVDEHLSTNFDEPVGIAFAGNAKAYVALGPYNEIAVVDVATREVTGRLPIRAQDPRAITVRGDRLYVVAFESGNQSQLSGCFLGEIGGDGCTFDAVFHVFTNNNVLSTDYDADIVKDPAVPDRDLFVFDTETDELIEEVNGLGTLLYGVAVDSRGNVFVAQTDARNVENGLAGSRGHGMAEMDNRAFLNQITRVDCASGCGEPDRFDLEPVPPDDPEPGMALATPFGIQVSDDDATLVATAAGSDRLFTVDAETGEVLGRVDVENTPRGLALVSGSDGAPLRAWVLNAVANSVSVVDLSSTANPRLEQTIALEDPTDPVVKRGRMAFNDADASSTGTFSCESCHPDNHTDQLIWVLQTPPCVGTEGCMDQVPPRLTMPAKGLRDTQPYHWDGIPGDPYGGINTASIDAPVDTNCSKDDDESCTRFLVDGSLATTMCIDLSGQCNDTNDEAKAGLLDAQDRDALATYLLSVPFPPAQARPFDNELTADGRDGFFEFSFINDSGKSTGAQTCGDCHKMPFLVSTNTPGTGMDAPTWRGAYDRFMITPQARTNVIDLMYLAFRNGREEPQAAFNGRFTFDERDIWDLAGASPEIWQMVLQGSTGFSGSFARQVTLNADTADDPLTEDLLDALEQSASEGGIILQAEGVVIEEDGSGPLALEFGDDAYRVRDGDETITRDELLLRAEADALVLTLTGRSGANIDKHLQPALWPVAPIHRQTRNVELALLSDEQTLRINAKHVQEGASLHLNGRRVDGSVDCEYGYLPDCDGDILIVDLDSPPPGGLHFLQLQNPAGLFSNDMMFFYDDLASKLSETGNLISSGGRFDPIRFERHNWNAVETEGVMDTSNDRPGIEWSRNGAVNIRIARASSEPWHAQISHAVPVVGGQEYTLCYDAKSNEGQRQMTAYTDTNMDLWRNTSGQQFRVDLTREYQQFKHTFSIAETDLKGRVAFDFAQSPFDVQMDNIGLYEGTECGEP